MARKLLRFLTLMLAVCLLFALTAPAASAEDVVIEKVYATSDKEAVVMRKAGEVAFTTSTEGASVASVSWTSSGGTVLGANDPFGQDVYTLVVTLKAADGYVFGAAAKGFLYGKSCDIAVSADGKTVSLRRQVEPPVWSPVIVKQPLPDPPVNPGGRVSFVSTADYSVSYQWFLVSPDGSETLNMIEAKERFPSAVFVDSGVSFTISNVPAEMNNWKAMCRFYESTGTYFTDSEKALIQVNVPEPTPEPSPEPTAEPETTPEPTAEPETTPEPEAAPEPEPTPEPTPEPAPEPTPQPLAWQSNEGGHWHESATGQTSDLAEHTLIWSTPDENGVEQGVCSVCGYTVSRVSDSASKQDVKGKLIIGLGVAAAVLMMLSLAAPRKKRR